MQFTTRDRLTSTSCDMMMPYIMKADDYFRQTEDLPLINPLTTHEEIAKFPELFDVHEAVSRVTTEVDILERHMRQPGMYPIPQSPISTTSGFVPNRPSSTFKPIHLAAPSSASGQATQGSPMVDRAQETGSSPGSSIPCAQKSPANSQPSPASTQGMSIQSNSTQVPQSQPQNVAQGQPSATNTQAIQQLPVAPQQHSLLLQPPVQAHMLHQSRKVSHNLCSLGSTHRVNPSGNKGNPHHLGKVLTLQLSLSFQQQRHSPMLYPTHQKTRSPNQMVDKE